MIDHCIINDRIVKLSHHYYSILKYIKIALVYHNSTILNVFPKFLK